MRHRSQKYFKSFTVTALIVSLLFTVPTVTAAPTLVATLNAQKQVASVQAPAYFGVAKNKNVIVLQLEAFQSFILNKSIDGQEITPNLNKLLESTVYFPNFYDQIGGGNTSDAEFMSVTGVLPISNGAVSVNYGNRKIPSLLRLLRNQNYVTSTFHADKLQFWKRINLYPALDWQEKYDLTYFGNEDVIGYGPSDNVLFTKTLNKLNEYAATNKKFFSEIVTLSGHKPYNFLPESAYTLTLPDSYNETLFGNYLQTQHYVDQEVGTFIENLKANNLWDNTVLVIYGDHFGLHPSNVTPDERPLIEAFNGKPYNTNEAFKVPLIIHAPGVTPKVNSLVGGQVDIMPTLANLLGISISNATVFGRDLFNQTSNLVVQPSYYTKPGSFITNNYFFLAGKNGYVDATVFNVETNLPMAKTVAMKKEYDRAMSILPLSSKYLESLPKRY